MFYVLVEGLLCNVDVTWQHCSLTLIDQFDTKCYCFSACHGQDGNLLLGCEDGIKALNPATEHLENAEALRTTVYSVVQHRRNIYALHRTNESAKSRRKSRPEIKTRIVVSELVFHLHAYQTLFECKADTVASMAVSDRYIAVATYNTSSLILYNFDTKSTVTNATVTPFGLHFLSNGDLLVTNRNPGSLSRYQLEDGRLTHVWTRKGLETADSVYSSPDGIIYVWSFFARTVYIISSDGKWINL